MNIEIINVKNEEELVMCSKLRKKVFGEEENAPEALYIIDEFDRKIELFYTKYVNLENTHIY